MLFSQARKALEATGYAALAMPICVMVHTSALAQDATPIRVNQLRFSASNPAAITTTPPPVPPVTVKKTAPSAALPTCKDGDQSPDHIKALIVAEATRSGVDAKLALAIADQESSFGQRNNSTAGARGPMQLIASTADAYGVSDICNPEQNIRGGIAFIRDLTAEFGGNVFLITAAYNSGQRRVYSAKGIPSNPETVNYVAKVTNAYYNFDNAIKGGKRAKSATVTPASAPETTTDQKTASQDNTWIGGSVMYVQ